MVEVIGNHLHQKGILAGAAIDGEPPDALGRVRHNRKDVVHLQRDALGLSVTRRLSYPFPRWAGKFFIYNRFETVAVRT